MRRRRVDVEAMPPFEREQTPEALTVIALAIMVIMWSWNDLLWPLVVNTDPESMPVSAGLASLQGQFLTNYPVLMAGSVMASLPLIIIFIA